MSAPVNMFNAAVVSAVLDVICADAGVREFFGSPPRVFDDETLRPIYPYTEFVSSETLGLAGAETPSGEHRLTFAVHVRHGGQAEAAEGLSRLAHAIRSADIHVPGARIALAHPVYLDVMRGKQPPSRRGLLRLRIVTEAEIENDGN